MRIGIAIILLVDLAIRSLSIKAFFTDEGFLPLEVLKNYNWNPYYFSLHAMSGDLWWQILLFILNAISIILLMIGYRTRLFTFICWVLLSSLQLRNPFILQSGDDLLRLVLFWGIFLPWGNYYSIEKKNVNSTTYFSIANIGYMLLVTSVYFFSSLLKTSDEWHANGTAIYYALSLDQMRLPFGTLLYQFPSAMNVLTHVVYYIELIAPLLILIPFVSSKFRVLGIGLIALLFLGIAGSLYVGLFYIIGIVSLIGLLPSSMMDYIELKFLKKKKSNVVDTTEEINDYKRHFITELIHVSLVSFMTLVICFCLMLNLGNLKSFPFMMETYLAKFGTALRLDQSWGMFSPSILKDDGWYIYAGYVEGKGLIDIKNNKDSVSYKKPENIVNTYESDRWRKYGENYTFNNNNHIRPYFCKYLLKKWNKEHPEKQVSEVTIFFMKEVSLPNYGTKPIEKLALCNCIDKE